MRSYKFAVLCSVAITAVALLSATASLGRAETIGYWRFESGANFLKDSGPNGLDLSVSGSPAPVFLALPEAGSGSAFDDPIPQTGQDNDGAANFGNATTGGWLSHADAVSFLLHDFTVEVYFNRDQNGTSPSLVSQYNSTGNLRSWLFGVRREASYDNKLFLQLSSAGGTPISIDSTFSASNLDHDYYAAVSFDESEHTGGVTFYLKDLTAGTPLQVETRNHTLASLFDSSADFTIGAVTGGGNRFPGVIDEVRLSNSILGESELLVSVPEPGLSVIIPTVLLGFVLLYRKGKQKSDVIY